MQKKEDNRSFSCTCCKRNIIFDSKYQCSTCEDVVVCKLCFKSKFHDYHSFLMRPAPDRDWEPAFRDDSKKENTDYQKLMEEL